MKDTTQLNVRLEERLARRLRVEAVESNTTLQVVMEAAIENLFSGWNAEQRRCFYLGKPQGSGRRVEKNFARASKVNTPKASE